MNPLDDQLNRLFRAAAQVKPSAVSAPAYGLETRALASWRTARSSDEGIWDITLLVRGLLLASLIMAVSFWPVLSSAESTTTTSNPFADYLQLTDSTVPSDDAP
jgi:hypothetical protein